MNEDINKELIDAVCKTHCVNILLLKDFGNRHKYLLVDDFEVFELWGVSGYVIENIETLKLIIARYKSSLKQHSSLENFTYKNPFENIC